MLSVILYIVLGLLLLAAVHPEIPTPRRLYYFFKLPGVKGYPIVGRTFTLLFCPPEEIFFCFQDWLNKHKRLVAAYFFGVCWILLVRPDDIQCLLESSQCIEKGREYDLMKLSGEGLVSAGGDGWKKRRRLCRAGYNNFRVLKQILDRANQAADELVDKIHLVEGKPTDLSGDIDHCAIDVIVDAAVGSDKAKDSHTLKKYIDDIHHLGAATYKRAFTVWQSSSVLFFLSTPGFRMRRTAASIRDFGQKALEEEKKARIHDAYSGGNPDNGKRKNSFIRYLINLEEQMPGSLSPIEMRNETINFVAAGFDTTGCAITLILFILGHNPDIQEKVYEEVVGVLRASGQVEMDDLDRLVYLEAVIMESLRLYPPISYISRRLTQDLVLKDGMIIPSGCNVAVSPYLVHREKDYYPDPERFDPERFMGEERKQKHPYGYLAFSNGPRMCIGRKIALIELKTVVSKVIRRFRVESITKREDLKFMPQIVLKSNRPIICKVFSRDEVNV